MKKILFILPLIIIYGCCDCLEPADDPTELPCNVREMTITEFDARVTEIEGQFDEDPELDTIYEPVDSYNIHAFTFGNGNTTGSLENDRRFSSDEGIDLISIVEYPVPGTNYKLAIFDNAPANEDINGDILIEDVQIIDPGTDYAIIRVSGFIGYYRQDFFSESSTRFCEYIRSNNDEIIDRFIAQDGPQDFSEYGEDLNPPRLITSSGNNNFGLVDNNGRIVIENINDMNQLYGGLNRNDYLQAVNAIDRSEEEEIYSIRVEVGDVFYYEARNGRSYLFAIINIDERDIDNSPEPAIKKRVSIIFSEI